MKATLERGALLKSLTHVHRVVERRNTIPILSNVLVRAETGEITLRATDLDLDISERAPALVERPGGTTVPALILYDIVRKLPEGAQILLDTSSDGATLEVRAGRSRFQLQVLPENDFPDLTTGDLPVHFTLPASALKHLIEATQFAISTEETRYYLNGIYLHVIASENGARLRAVATDGHRLAQTEVMAPEGSAEMPGIIVPRKTVSEILRLSDGEEGDVNVSLSDTKLRMTVGAVVLTSKLIDGTFPDYERVIPRNNDKELRLDRDSFTAAVDRVSSVSSERGRAVKLAMETGRLVLTMTNPDSGVATDELTADYDDSPLEIGFNSRYLMDIAQQLRSDTISFLLADPGSPTLIREAEATETIYVLMPMRV